VVVESAAALPVDDVSGVLRSGWADDAKVRAAWEPEPELTVEVLDLTALPRRVRLTEPTVDPVGGNKMFPLSPLRSLVETERLAQVRRDLLACFDQASKGTVALSHYDGRVVAVCHSMWWWCWASGSFEAYWRHCRRPQFALDDSMQQCQPDCVVHASAINAAPAPSSDGSAA